MLIFSPSAEYLRWRKGLWKVRQCAECHALETGCLGAQAHLLPREQSAMLLRGLFGWSVRQIVLPVIKARIALNSESEEVDSDWIEVEKVVLE